MKVMQDCEQRWPGHCNRLQERFNALTREKNRLENQISELNNMVNNLEEERNRLKINLRGEQKSKSIGLIFSSSFLHINLPFICVSSNVAIMTPLNLSMPPSLKDVFFLCSCPP